MKLFNFANFFRIRQKIILIWYESKCDDSIVQYSSCLTDKRSIENKIGEKDNKVSTDNKMSQENISSLQHSNISAQLNLNKEDNNQSNM